MHCWCESSGIVILEEPWDFATFRVILNDIRSISATQSRLKSGRLWRKRDLTFQSAMNLMNLLMAYRRLQIGHNVGTPITKPQFRLFTGSALGLGWCDSGHAFDKRDRRIPLAKGQERGARFNIWLWCAIPALFISFSHVLSCQSMAIVITFENDTSVEGMQCNWCKIHIR